MLLTLLAEPALPNFLAGCPWQAPWLVAVRAAPAGFSERPRWSELDSAWLIFAPELSDRACE